MSNQKDPKDFLYEGERLDDLQRDGMYIIQNPKWFCFGMDAVLLSAFARVYPGEKVLIAGPSGSGKSTLAGCVNGLNPFSNPGECKGSLIVDGVDAPKSSIFPLSAHVGTVLQDPDGQFIGLTVGEDIAFALENSCMPQDEMHEITRHAAELVGIQDHLDYAPHELSGGMQQRVAIARTLANDPDVVLMDDDPLKIAKGIKISRKCLRIVKQNIWLAIGIKVLCLALGGRRSCQYVDGYFCRCRRDDSRNSQRHPCPFCAQPLAVVCKLAPRICPFTARVLFLFRCSRCTQPKQFGIRRTKASRQNLCRVSTFTLRILTCPFDQNLFWKLLPQMPQISFRPSNLLLHTLCLIQIFVNAFQQPIRSSGRVFLKLNKTLNALQLHAVGSACRNKSQPLYRLG